ncbi:hypothetical protein [Streptomyces cacaoi]|uniref:hypothetical protein n=1 Tax=Streptomyces cacaoi TaxID=1898 RepID=UPI0026031E8B|nr:hypothetical protein [Streptomyces cacaoi]
MLATAWGRYGSWLVIALVAAVWLLRFSPVVRVLVSVGCFLLMVHLHLALNGRRERGPR